MKRLLATVAVLAAVSALGLLQAPSAHAVGEVVGVGWWTRLPTTSAPEGGFAVGRAPDGATSVAAVRLDLGSGVSFLELSAAEAGGSVDTAVIRACMASDDWTPVSAGAFADRPDIDCGLSVAMQRGEDGTWRADVSALVAGRSGSASIGLVADAPSGDDPVAVAPVEVQFNGPAATGAAAPPASGSVTTTSRPFSSPPTTSGRSPFLPNSSPLTIPPSTGGATTDTTVFEFPEPTTTTTIAIVEERAMGSVTDAGVEEGEGRPVREAFFLIFIAAVVGLGVALVSRYLEARA